MLITLLVALFIIGADQLSKYLIVGHMSLNQTIPVIDGALYLHYVRNNGAAFSMLRGFQWLFIGASIIASIGIVIYLARTKTPIHWLGLLSLGLILGGALGNLFDRLMHANHEVIDFIYVNIRAIKFDFAIFNVADAGVSVGAVLLCIYILFMHEKHVKKIKAKTPEETEVSVIEQTEN
jgi:signal peptidase II